MQVNLFLDHVLCSRRHGQGRRFTVKIEGDGSGSLGDGSPPAGSRSRAPGGGLGLLSPQKLKTFDNMVVNLVAICAWKMFKSHRDC